jgi:hypothetical protein
MADGLESDDVEMEDMDRAGSGRRGSTSFDGEHRGGTLNPLTAGSTSLSGSPLMSPMGSLTGDETSTSAARGGGTFSVEAPSGSNNEEHNTNVEDGNEETLIPLAGINDDGYFGDAAGNWLRLEPRARITFETRGAEDKSFAREVLDFCNAYGTAVFGSMLLVGVLTTVLIVWASHVEQRSQGGGARRALAATTLSSL